VPTYNRKAASGAPTTGDGFGSNAYVDNNGNIWVRTAAGGTGDPQYVRLQDGTGTTLAGLVPDNVDNTAPVATATRLATAARLHVFDGTNWGRVWVAGQTADANSLQNTLGAGVWVYNGATWDRIRSASATGAGLGVQLQAVTPVGTSGTAPSNADSTALATNLVIKATAGTLYGLSGINNNAAIRYIQLFNSATLPADAAVPAFVIQAAATSNFSVDFGSYGRFFSTGIVVCNSSTLATKTIGAADSWFDARFV
jgi:hypothetical protein